MSLLLRYLLLCLLLKSSVSSDLSPSCKSLRDYNHQLSQEELAGHWYLCYIGSRQTNLGSISSSSLDLHIIDKDHVQVRQVIKYYYVLRTEEYDMEITKENNSYTLTAKDDDHTFTIYPLKDHVVLYKDEDGVRLFCKAESSGKAFYSGEGFRHLTKCLQSEIILILGFNPPDPKHSDKDCQDYQPVSKGATVNEILGKKALLLSAYTRKEYAKRDQSLQFILQNLELEGDKLKGKYLFGAKGSLQSQHSPADMKEENGVITLRDFLTNTTMNAYSMDNNCVAYTASPQTENNYTGFFAIYCGSNISWEDIHKVEQHAKCQKFPYTILRKYSTKIAFPCEDVIHPVEHVTVEQLAGRWHYVASATDFDVRKESEGQWVQFEVQDGELNLTDSFRFRTEIPVKLSGNTLSVLTDLADKVTVTFYEVGEEVVLVNIHIECSWGKYYSLNLFSKSGNADATQIERFKKVASCANLPVIYTKK